MSSSVLDAPRLRKELAGLLLKQPKEASHTGVCRVARTLWKSLGTPLALRLLSALNSGDVDTIARASVDPRKYDNAEMYYLDACAAAFLRKAEFLGELGSSELDPKAEARRTFFQTETQCKDTNERLQMYAEGRLLPLDGRVPAVLEDARHFIKSILPPVPKLSELEVRFGPGATSRCSGDSVTLADKLAAFPEVTFDSRHLVDVVKNSDVWFNLLSRVHPGCLYKPLWVTDDYGDLVLVKARTTIAPRLTRGNRFTTVRKDAKTDRGICIEPHTTGAIQLILGEYLSNVLRRIGITKEYQEEIHGRLAEEASRKGTFCTVDLKAASDTISYELVKLLLPWDWFELLASLRSPETYIDGNWVELEKFSSMGNGFTFELETLLFYALTRSVSNLVDGPYQALVSCFGDDIICSSASYELLTHTIAFCGFTINHEKTYVGCGFNESCGHDYFEGTDVRPYFLKGAPQYVTDWYGMANGIRRMATRHAGADILSPVFRRAWLAVLDNIPPALRFYGPSHLGDSVIHEDDRTRWSTTSRNGNVRIKVIGSDFAPQTVSLPRDDGLTRVYGLKPVIRERSMRRWCESTIYAALLYATSRGGSIDCSAGSFSLRGDPEKLVVTWFVA
jgi:hypothetical protein